MTNQTIPEFLRPFLVDPAPPPRTETPKTDVGKATRFVLEKLRDEPTSVTKKDMRDVVWAEGSQIGEKERYFGHITNVAGIYRDLTEKLGEVGKLDILTPKEARTNGLVHDIDSTFTKYGGVFGGHSFAQLEKQLSEYFLFRGLGLERLAKQVPMHCAYFEILKMIANGKGFSEVGMYKEWTRELNDNNSPFNFRKIRKDFNLFLQGKGNFPLMTLVISDYLDNGKSTFNEATMEQDFTARKRDIITRYYDNKVKKREEPSALGIALVKEGGAQRITNYFKIVKDLVNRKEKSYRKSHKGLYKK